MADPFSTATLMSSFSAVWAGLALALPKIVFAIIFILIGILVGWLIKHAIEEIFKALKIDDLLNHTGLDELMERAGYRLNSGLFIGEIVRWFFVVVFLIFALDIVGLNQITAFLGHVATSFIPNVIVSVLIVFAGSILATAVSKLVSASARAAGYDGDKMLGSISSAAIWVFTIVVALDQIGIASFYLQTFYQAIVFMIALAGALAFGLGGRDAAGKAIELAKKKLK